VLKWPYPAAVTLSYLTAFALSFVLNRAFNFRSHEALGPQTAKYVVAVGINFAVFVLGVGDALTAVGVEYQLARILSGLGEGVYMYCVMRWVVFRGAPRGLAGPAPPGPPPAGAAAHWEQWTLRRFVLGLRASAETRAYWERERAVRSTGGPVRSERMGATFERLVPVRWRDSDALGHVNHAVFVTYLEEGRDAFYLEVLGDPNYVVVRIEMDLRAEVRHGDEQVTVRVRPERLGRTSLTTSETILTAAGQVAAEARVVTVRWDPAQRQPVPFSAAERMRLEQALAG
jgi:YbgC/YbaW family acyl-CoA thioester hydrolase